MQPPQPVAKVDDREFNLEREKIALEREKVAIEREELNLEIRKLKVEKWKSVFTAISIAVPLAVVAITVYWGYASERARAETEFQLKAAEIVFAHQNPYEMKGRARILKTLFAEKLPPDFGENFDEQKFAVPLPSNSELLIRLLVEHKDQRADIIRMWRTAYPDDRWVDALNPGPATKK